MERRTCPGSILGSGRSGLRSRLRCTCGSGLHFGVSGALLRALHTPCTNGTQNF